MAIPSIGRASQAPDPRYNAEHFDYDKKNDTYTCPQGKLLTSNGSWYKGRNYRFKQYKTRACKNCPVRYKCTTAKANGKIVQRSEFTRYIEANAERVKESGDYYKKRQALVEHPFGTIKRQWGFDHIVTKKGITSASADFGLIPLAYNLRRLFNIKTALKRPFYHFPSLSTLLGQGYGILKEIVRHTREYPLNGKFSSEKSPNHKKQLI